MVSNKKESHSLQQFSSFLLFVTIAALLWLIIKLSASYTVTEPLTINFKDAPANLIVTNETQEIKITLSSRGFDLLHYYLKPSSRRKVDISLEEVPLHKDSESTYSFSSSYAKEKVAQLLTIEPNEVSFDENRILINMERLDSTRVKVISNLDLTYEKQYNKHGKIQITPDSVTIYGPKNKLASLTNVYTENISLKNVNSKIDMDVPISFSQMTSASFTVKPGPTTFSVLSRLAATALSVNSCV